MDVYEKFKIFEQMKVFIVIRFFDVSYRIEENMLTENPMHSTQYIEVSPGDDLFLCFDILFNFVFS